MNEEKRSSDDASNDGSEPYRTPIEVSGDAKPSGLLNSKRLWLALLAVGLLGGGAFAMLSTRAVIDFGNTSRGRPPQLQESIQNFGEDRDGDNRDYDEDLRDRGAGAAAE